MLTLNEGIYSEYSAGQAKRPDFALRTAILLYCLWSLGRET